MKQFIQIFSFVGLCLCASSSFATDRHTDYEIEKAHNLGASTNKVEQFFREEQTTMWFSIESQDYTYKDVYRNQAVVVKIGKFGLFGCNLSGNLALFPSSPQDISKIYKSSLSDFNDSFGTPFNCIIQFYANTDKKFLVLDFIEVGYQQGGKGFAQFATDAFINFAKKHTSAQYILCDPRNYVYKTIADKFSFKEDKGNAIWSNFTKGVKVHYILELS